ncbi:MAG: flagellar basal-body MS-ring/collar protein FliF [Termitinemataceae bacterium]|jgi:flagellar M-ring protein FliF|nr:MAG: flagellar basal-body MS-ring/collar protein FliF [Termitinemataceae bacterium]
MPDFISKFLNQLKDMWAKWSMVQRLMLAGIAAAAFIAIVALVSFSSSPGMIPVIDTPILNEDERARIVTRINAEGIRTSVSSAGIISVPDETSARKMRSILIREDLIPKGTDPWALFDRERWTITDWERSVNLRRAITDMITEHIKALPEIDNANVVIVQPEKALFASEQDPVTASVIITPKIGSDIAENRKKIEGIQKILKHAVQGLIDDNITITDQNGIVLNDFEGMKEFDRLTRIKEELKIVRDTEAVYKAKVLSALQQQFTQDRVRDLNLKIDMDMSKKTVESSQYKPVMLKERTPGLAYDDSERKESLTISETTSTTSWEGTGFNPEGPPGTEGQTPPAFKDMSNLYGKVKQETRTHNEVFNEEKIQEERSPTINRVTVSVNIDGRWEKKYDEKGNIIFLPNGRIDREYVPVTPEDMAQARALVEGAIGYNATRGDSVNVQNIQIDRTAQFVDEDKELLRQRQIQITIIVSLIGIAFLLIGFIVFHIVSRAREQARRRREEELARQHQLMREQAMLDADKSAQEVSLSVEDQARLDLLEKSMNLAREHPQDVSQLIRTWLMEE